MKALTLDNLEFKIESDGYIAVTQTTTNYGGQTIELVRRLSQAEQKELMLLIINSGHWQ